MPRITRPFNVRTGPRVDVRVAQPASRPNFPDALPQTLAFLIDSGAEQTCISTRAALSLNLPILGMALGLTATRPAFLRQYLADLSLQLGTSPVDFADIPLLEFSSTGGGFDGLLGRDLLASGVFEMNGPAGTFTLMF